jgi:thiosulfate reductase cytochrome b subunit
MKKIFLYPFWLRFWHWLNALLFLILIVSGLSLHYADPKSFFIPFRISILTHNIAGILLSLNYIFFFIVNITSRNYRYYVPEAKGFFNRAVLQVKYYIIGILIGERHPFSINERRKFNPLQQIAYIFIMFFFMPVIIVSGWLLMFPEIAPEEFIGMGGVWPMALAHAIAGFILSIFMFVHIYLGTTGNTISELFKSMISGWHLTHDEDLIPEVVKKDKSTKEEKRMFPVVFYNPTSLTGSLISILSFIIILFLIVIEFFSEASNPYLGIVTFIVLPTFLIIGLFLIAFGAIKENRRILSLEVKSRKLPIIDLNNPRHQVATFVFLSGSILLTVFSIFGTFKAYEYTDSDEFCGKVCHTVMEPQFTAYQDSPHSRVGCVTCHIGSGADWYVKSKLSGAYQVYSVIFNKYSRPIPTPVHNLRPAQQTCEQCHWPKHFYNEKKKNFDFFTSDENNTEYQLSMLLRVGGGSAEFGNHSGIHWVMNLANEISYLHLDEEREIIPWVKSKSKATGKETIYRDTSYKITGEMLKTEKLRVMDCLDCHNRPSHVYYQPNRMINAYISNRQIDRTIPYIKNVGVQVLETYTRSRKTSHEDISKFIWNFYNKNYPDVAYQKKKQLTKLISFLHKIYMRNYFPEMKANWKNYPNHIGHMYSPGCFRCHDGKHVSDDGKVITNDCNTCHIIATQKPPGMPFEESSTGLKFYHPGGADKLIGGQLCSNCHGVRKKSMVLNIAEE